MLGILKRHWGTMTQDPRLKEIFPVPPLVAYKRPPNIKDKLIRSKVPPANNPRPKRKVPGMKKCNRCGVCPYVREGKTVAATSTNFKTDVNGSVDCSTSNIIYLLGCKKCPQQYIGVYSVSDMHVTILEKVFNQDIHFRKQREKLYIQKFNTRYKGLNKMNGG